jgi:hypothetical protein
VAAEVVSSEVAGRGTAEINTAKPFRQFQKSLKSSFDEIEIVF